MATAPVVTETDAGTVVVVPTESQPSTSEAEWQQKLAQIFTMMEETRSQMGEMRGLYQSHLETLTNLVQTQQETIARLSGQVSDGTAQVVAAIATLTPPPAPVIVQTETPLLEGSQTESPASVPQGEQNPTAVQPESGTHRRRRFL